MLKSERSALARKLLKATASRPAGGVVNGSGIVDRATAHRASGRAPPPRRVWPWTVSIAVGIVAVGGALYALLPHAVPIQVAVAEPVAGAAVGPSSILDASGYVVARRQATVSSKITGKVVTVGIEEGQRVERDEVIARLDDTNARAGRRAGARRARAGRGESRRGRGRVREREADVPAQRAAARARRHQRADVRHGEGELRRGAHRPRGRRARASRSRKRGSRSPSAISTTPSCARRSPAS